MINTKVIEDSWKIILTDGLGLDLSDPNLKDTPKRIAKFYKEFFTIRKTAYREFPSRYDGIVIISTTGYSMCSHHFLPFSYKCHVGYIPKKNVIGASKIARIVDKFAKRPQLQERLTEEIADFICDKYNVEGVIVAMSGEHLCMKMRGVEKQSSGLIDSSVRGNFTEPQIRNEFFNLLKIFEPLK